MKTPSPPKWTFAARFRRNAFGWRSDLPIQRIKEALTEIRQVARKDPVLAAQGAIVLLEKLSPALEHVDSSSGALGSWVNRAIDTLAPLIAKADVSPAVRQKWLSRLWEALQEDEMPYLEHLTQFWGEMCVTPQLASTWADELLPTVKSVWGPTAQGHGYFMGTEACLSALYAAARYEELLALLETARTKHWHDRQWGVKALLATGRKAQALAYAQEMQDGDHPNPQIAQVCEDIVLTSGMSEIAYQRYAIAANQGPTNLATFRAIAKKYPDKASSDILHDLVHSQPGSEGKWFAAAKEAGLFDEALALARRSPTDPRTLTRAARDFAEDRAHFALNAGLLALHWMAAGHGYEITGADVMETYLAVLHAATAAGVDERQIKARITEMLQGNQPARKFMHAALARQLTA